jgi:plastocyanin
MTGTLTLCFLCGAVSVACAQARDTTLKAGVAGAPAPAAQASASASAWLTWDAATSTATFKLVAGAPGAKSPFNFDGYTDGEATLVVPPGVHIVINFVNEDGTPHSAEVITAKDPIPNMGGDPAIPAAYTRDVTQGLPQFGKDVMRFTAPDHGEYRIFCGVPGHGLSGMWIRFRVDPAAKAASFGPTKE